MLVALARVSAQDWTTSVLFGGVGEFVEPGEDDCFLCGRGATLSNPVAVGNMTDLREIWARVADTYRAQASVMLCSPSAANHTHCRTYLRNLQQMNGDSEERLDAMARCYPITQLVRFLEVLEGPKSHRRCRGGLLSLLRMLEAWVPGANATVRTLDTASPCGPFRTLHRGRFLASASCHPPPPRAVVIAVIGRW